MSGVHSSRLFVRSGRNVDDHPNLYKDQSPIQGSSDAR